MTFLHRQQKIESYEISGVIRKKNTYHLISSKNSKSASVLNKYLAIS